MHDLMRLKYSLLAADTPNIDGAGSVGEWIFPNPVVITKVGILVTTTVDTDNSVALTATLSRRPIAGSSSNEVDLGTFAMAAANNSTTLVAGVVKYKELAIADNDGETAEDGTQRNVAPNAALTPPLTDFPAFLILPGQSFVMTLDASAEADSGAVRGWVEYIDLPFTGAYIGKTNVKRDVTDDAT